METDSLRGRLSLGFCLSTTLFFIASITFVLPVYADETYRKLLVGTERGFYPFADVDEEGVPTGFSVDLFRAVAREMDIGFEFRTGTWKEILTAIEHKQIDVLPFVKHTERRDRFLDFSITHIFEHAIAIKRRDGQSIASPADMSGKDIVVMEADGTHLYMAAHVPEASLFLVPTVSEALLGLASGTYDYAVVPRTVGLVKIRDLGLDNLQPTGPLMEAYARGFSIGVQDGDRDTLATVNQGLNLVKESGEYQQIYSRWFGGIDPRTSSEKLRRRLWYAGLTLLLAALIAAFWLLALRRRVVQRTEEVKRRREAMEAVEKMNKVLQKKNEELATYDHTIAHNLKTPLAATGRFLEILTKYKADSLSDEQRHLATQALSSLKMSEEGVDALLMLSTVSHEQIEQVSLHMERLVQQALDQLQHEQTEARAKVTLPTTWLTALGYAPWIGQVWLIYLGNAFKYSNVPARVELGSAPDEANYNRFWVRSNGRQLTEEEQGKLFLPFSRLHDEECPGHGLGLTIVKRIVERLGGTAGVRALPEFSNEFFFTLPMCKD